ncbi:MAG: kelch repeat-containing protein [Kofleriaceae bacterium]|nr:kelch repeat-containing protein [Kofleriaceae bacterium]
MHSRCVFALALAGCGDAGSGATDAATNADAAAPCTPAPGWADAPPLIRGAAQETATVAVDGKIYVLGGFDDALAVLDTVQIFDPEMCVWSAGPALPRAVHHANAAVVNGTIYITGALETLGFTAVGYVWRWTPATESTWTELAPMPAGTERGSAVAGAIGTTIYLAGGLRGDPVALVSAYETSTATWDTSLPSLPAPRDHGCGGVVGDTLFITGGRAGAIASTTGSVLAYTPGGAWETRAPMPTARGGTACGVIDDRIYVVGGEGNDAVASGVFAESEAYVATEDRWEVLADMTVPRHGMGAAATGRALYVPGGATRQGFGAVATHQVFTP